MSLTSSPNPAREPRLRSKAGSVERPAIEWGAATFTLQGQTASGDRFVVAPFASGVLVAAIDGLGHGDGAASAAERAADCLARFPHEPVDALVRRCHEDLRRTRGVVMSLAAFGAGDGTMTWLGVGNVEGRLVRSGGSTGPPVEYLLLRSGVVGGDLPPLRATTLSVAPGDTLLLATDGVVLPTVLRVGPQEPAQAVAERNLARQKKDTDDALILVARWVGPA